MTKDAVKPQRLDPLPSGPCVEGALSLLLRYMEQIPAGGRVLEIGAGQGERALPLARRGWRVTAIEAAPGAADGLRGTIAGDNLALELPPGDCFTAEIEGMFDAVLAFDRLQSLTRGEGASLLYRLMRWVAPGGLLFLSSVHVDDQSYDACRAQWERIGLHSFRAPTGLVRTFLARDEILDLMMGWDVLHHCEGRGPEHEHAAGPPERHGVVEIVARRTDDTVG
jgi:tellurite methyltransferase